MGRSKLSVRRWFFNARRKEEIWRWRYKIKSRFGNFKRAHFNKDEIDRQNFKAERKAQKAERKAQKTEEKAQLKEDRKTLDALKKEAKFENKGDKKAIGKAYRDKALSKMGKERANKAMKSKAVRKKIAIGVGIVAGITAVRVAATVATVRGTSKYVTGRSNAMGFSDVARLRRGLY